MSETAKGLLVSKVNDADWQVAKKVFIATESINLLYVLKKWL